MQFNKPGAISCSFLRNTAEAAGKPLYNDIDIAVKVLHTAGGTQFIKGFY